MARGGSAHRWCAALAALLTVATAAGAHAGLAITRLRYGTVEVPVVSISSWDEGGTNAFVGTVDVGPLDNHPTQSLFVERIDADTGRVLSGTTPFNLSTPFTPAGSSWTYTITSGGMSSGGIVGTLRIYLPESTTNAILYRRTETDIVYRETFIDAGFRSFDAELRPSGTLAFTNSSIARLKLENEPWELRTVSGGLFDDATGFTFSGVQFHYKFKDEFDENPGLRPATDMWLQSGTVVGNVTLTPQGLNLSVEDSAPTTLLAGFPEGLLFSDVEFSMTVANSVVSVPTISAGGGLLSQREGDCVGGGGNNLVAIGATTFVWGADGALIGTPTNPDDANLIFDAYTVGPIEDAGTVYLPGGRSIGSLSPQQYLLAGRESTSTVGSAIHVFGEEEYNDGNGYYAGYNFGPAQLEGAPFTVSLACEAAPFSASQASKLYVRQGGVSGTLKASDSSVAALPPLNLYGEYDTTLTAFTQSFLDNLQAGESLIDGHIDLPFPSDTQLGFRSLSLEECGSPGNAKIEEASSNVLAYWNREFKFTSLDFAPLEPVQYTSCGTIKQTLWTTSTNAVPELGKAMLVSTNFKGNGDIREARIAGDAANTLQQYPFTTRGIYYSKWDGSKQQRGLTTVTGDMKLPFWGATPVVALWNIGTLPQVFDGRSYAQSPPIDIDPDKNGFPAGIASIEQYLADANKRPRVEGSFAKIVPLDYRVKYDNIARRFATVPGEEKGRDLVVLEVSSSVRGISRTDTEILFGVSYSGLPNINASSLLENLADPALQALLQPIKDGMAAVNESLSGKLHETIRGAMTNVTRPLVVPIAQQLKNAANGVPSVDQATVDAILNAEFPNISAQLQLNLGDPLGPISAQIDKALDGLETVEQKIASLDPQQVEAVLVALIELTDGDPSGVEAIFDDVEAARAYIVDNLIKQQLRPALQKVRAEIQNLGGLAKVKVLVEGPDFSASLSKVQTELRKYINTLRTDAAKLRNLNPEELNKQFVNTLYNTTLMKGVNSAIATVLEPLRQQIQSILNAFFDTLNNQVKAYLAEVGGALDQALQPLNDVAGMASAEMAGYAVFGGESLDRLHIDAKFELKSPDAFGFRGSLDMERFKNDTNGVVCGTPAGFESIRTKIAVYDIPLSFGRGDLRAKEIALLLRLNQDGGEDPQFYLSDVAGKIETEGAINFEAAKIVSPLFAAGVGENETYIAFRGTVVFSGKTATGGIFLGKTCNGVEILKTIDPEVDGVFTQDEISGIYAFAECAIPIIDYSCLLRISATVGAGLWYFTEGPSYGGKLSAGVCGEGLCIIGVRGKLVLIGGKEGPSYFFKGSGWLAGGIGWCEPEQWNLIDDVWADKWCYTCVLFADVLYRQKWSVDYGADCE